jgi:hypothetical protein
MDPNELQAVQQEKIHALPFFQAEANDDDK